MFMNQRGNARLYGSMIMLFLIIVPVVIYQAAVSPSRQQQKSAEISVAVTGYKEAQLFKQTLPVISGLLYELLVTDEQNRTFSLVKFSVEESGILTNEFGHALTGDVFTLPEQLEGVKSASLNLTDGVSGGISILFLNGFLINDRIILRFPHIDLEKISGQFMLGTPTDNNTFLNERSGLWFGSILKNESGLDLPPLPTGWIYEGWGVVKGQTLTTGRFANASDPDVFSGFSDNKAPAPSFPGEDFLRDPPVLVFPDLTFPVDLGGQVAAITIEPNHNNVDPTGSGPFPLKILQADIPGRADAYRAYDFEVVNRGELPESTFLTFFLLRFLRLFSSSNSACSSGVACPDQTRI